VASRSSTGCDTRVVARSTTAMACSRSAGVAAAAISEASISRVLAPTGRSARPDSTHPMPRLAMNSPPITISE
jgi:hypothetical protein